MDYRQILSKLFLPASLLSANPCHDNLGQIGADYGIVQWSCPANPNVIFANTIALQTTVTFPRDGYYELMLYVQDDAGK